MPISTIVKLRTVRLSDNSVHLERENNYDDPGFRRFLERHIHWAVTNGYGVQLWNAIDGEPV